MKLFSIDSFNLFLNFICPFFLTFTCLQFYTFFSQATSFRNSVLAASWSELGRVDIWNITQQLQAVDDPALLERYNLDTVNNPVKPLYSFNGHQQEGFGIDWCPTETGVSYFCKIMVVKISRGSRGFAFNCLLLAVEKLNGY